jgi:hypothetical protein
MRHGSFERGELKVEPGAHGRFEIHRPAGISWSGISRPAHTLLGKRRQSLHPQLLSSLERSSDFDEMKADEYRYWQSRPAHERLR